ncbi:MAG: HigA family addiction module antidote protein [Lactobacillaceae bacterium]|jgi:addiction module HigA family antidote|nr:HigA family addiction module antidote protein [Lactobacillaceae bacterium]
MLKHKNKIILSDAGETSAADMLAETLAMHKIKQTEFAVRIGVSQKHLSRVLNKKAFMSPDLALRIELVTGLSARLMLRLDTNYQLLHTNKPEHSVTDNELFLESYDWSIG